MDRKNEIDLTEMFMAFCRTLEAIVIVPLDPRHHGLCRYRIRSIQEGNG